MELIHSYTRAQAIADGVLVDVTKTAQEAGICHPTALTCAVWSEYVRVPDGVSGQDEAGRLWDIVWMLRWGIQPGCRDVILYRLYVRNNNRAPAMVTLKAVCGPGDDREPVITIMLPHED